MTYDEIIAYLKENASPEKVLFKKKKFGIQAHNSLGVYHKELRVLASRIGKNNQLAEQLFDSNIYEARLLCSKIYNPKQITERLMEKWVQTFENWEICDSFSMTVFAKGPFALKKIKEWTQRKAEFEKRSGFAIMAAYCMADKKAENKVYEDLLPIIENAVFDDRLYVKKAVNWALRSIGKRNKDLNQLAIGTANKIMELAANQKDDVKAKTARWIAKDALKELQAEKVNILDYPRAIYRP